MVRERFWNAGIIYGKHLPFSCKFGPNICVRPEIPFLGNFGPSKIAV